MNIYKKKLNKAQTLFNNKVILHTSPHPDDVTLGYFPYINWLLKNSNNEHFFLTMTSGSNAVRNKDLKLVLDSIEQNTIQYNNNNNNNNNILEGLISKKILNMAHNTNNRTSFLEYIRLLRKDLIQGEDKLDIKILKSLIREFEEESVWLSLGIKKNNIIPFRANFYFYSKDSLNKDVDHMYQLLLKINPDIITLAIDPKGIGPLTHYKTFLIIQDAIKLFYKKTKKKIKVIGYRNVWYQFDPNEADLIFPVDNSDFKMLNKTFLNSYKTQINAMFPNPNYKGNFAQISIKIMQENFKNVFPYLKNELYNYSGVCFLKEFNINKFLKFDL